ncbi:MAG: VacJ family lipoprotein [Proteobacteria bacterium]|nr:VacJ family lipoprotein [Pseudomonadota bacterium]
MNLFFPLIFLLNLIIPSLHAQEDAWNYMNEDLHPGETLHMNAQELEQVLEPSPQIEDDDPWEPMNRGIFAFNDFLDEIFFDRIAAMYKGVVPEFFRERVGYVLRNLSEPIVLANNLLQGEMGDAEDTLRRFLINSTVGIGGLFDISTGLDIPYKKEDFGLTLASWGIQPGPYLVLPILGPSTLRDTVGRIGDYGFDPINWWAYLDDRAVYSYTRSGMQLLDAKADNIEIIKELKTKALDPYLAFREWYLARREYLISKETQNLDTPRPDDEDEDL